MKRSTAAQDPTVVFHNTHLSLRDSCTNVACLGSSFAELLLWPLYIALSTLQQTGPYRCCKKRVTLTLHVHTRERAS